MKENDTIPAPPPTVEEEPITERETPTSKSQPGIPAVKAPILGVDDPPVTET